ncbi:MAG TPA: glycoside hydrolase family 3 N-terminal domain-containing protein [Desulfopila sp.]|nr:glycoside hydrolase family 3 N-terminal domain-containing protein [Desulfopila sp.]
MPFSCEKGRKSRNNRIITSPFSAMDIDTSIGQLFLLGFRGASPAGDSGIVKDIATRNLGGVILFDTFVSGRPHDSNIVDREQLQKLSTFLQSMADTPLFIAVDQEGGKVRRLKEHHGFRPLPSARELGGKDPQASFYQASLTAGQLAACGINCNFAPVADIDITPSNPIIGALGRSFSPNADVVTAHCEAWLDGLRSGGVLGCLKHFPGHGSSTADSHTGFVDISSSWQQRELEPYSRLFATGKVSALMLGHLFNSRLDRHHPASLSEKVVGGLLRRQMHFDGLVITDDLQMRAITDRYGLDEAVVQALAAGVDQVIIGNNLAYESGILARMIIAVQNGLDSGRLTEKRLRDSLGRIARLKGEVL